MQPEENENEINHHDEKEPDVMNDLVLIWILRIHMWVISDVSGAHHPMTLSACLLQIRRIDGRARIFLSEIFVSGMTICTSCRSQVTE